MWKALANDRAFLLLAAGLTVTEARRKRTGVLAGNKSANAAAGVAGHAEPHRLSRPDIAELLRDKAGRCTTARPTPCRCQSWEPTSPRRMQKRCH